MKDETTKDTLSKSVVKTKDVLDSKAGMENSLSEQSPEPSFSEESQKEILKDEKTIKNNALIEKLKLKKPKSKNPAFIEKDENLKLVQARRLQMTTYTNNEQAVSSPLQMHLVQSESLKVAQEKLSDLEEEILSLREKNSALVSAAEVLKENNETFKMKAEEIKSEWNDEKEAFKEEKSILLSAIDEARNQIFSLRNQNQELEKRISGNFNEIRQRENSLEGRIEILKMENLAFQKEKDKKILDLKKDILRLESNLENAHKKNHKLNISNSKLKTSSRRAVSALRATIYNLEGAKLNEETVVSQSKKLEKAS